MKGSLHYDHLALDLRVWNLDDHETLARKLQERLGLDFDVIPEWANNEGERIPSHIHAEYDPR